MVPTLHAGLARSFELDKSLALDPALRTSANEMSQAHLARIDKLLPLWLDQERRLQTVAGKAPPPNELYYAVWARLLNELALWQIEPGDADYERATLAALKTSPRVCVDDGDRRFTDFSSRILRVQAMPPEQRSAALATERRLLARWGQARAAIAPWPDPLPQDAAMSLARRAMEGDPPPRMALPPVLASDLLGEQKDYSALPRTSQCRLQQWWLQESLRQGATPAAALNAFRYGTLISASDRLAGMFEAPNKDGKADPAAATPAYPKFASRFLVTGATTVRVQLDGAGKPLQASIAAREIEVNGIRGVRPVAFENTFDAVSLNYALVGRHYDKPASDAPYDFQMAWNLDAPAGTTRKSPKGSKQ